MKVHVGIDPDRNGYACAITVEDGSITAHRFHRLPMVPAGKGYTLNSRAFAELVAGIGDHATVLLEQSQSWPGMGVAGAFRYGELFGKLQATLEVTGVQYRTVRPAVWWTGLDLPVWRASVSHAEKRKWRERVLRERIAQWFPSVTVPLRPRAKVEQPGACSAFALAWYSFSSNSGADLLDPLLW